MNRAAIEKPFSEALVKTRKGAFGKELNFVEAIHYIRRLNDAFDGGWTWRIASHEVIGSEVLVHGILEAGGQVKHAFGGTAITTNKSTGEVVSTADDLKAAATDALKKACSLFGIGLDLYGREVEVERQGAAGNSNGSDSHAGGSLAAISRSEGENRNRLTAKQLKAIYAIGHMNNMTDVSIRQLAVKTFRAAPEFLTRATASSFIDQLKAV